MQPQIVPVYTGLKHLNTLSYYVSQNYHFGSKRSISHLTNSTCDMVTWYKTRYSLSITLQTYLFSSGNVLIMDQNCEAAQMWVDSLASFPQAMFVDVVHESCSDVIWNNGLLDHGLLSPCLPLPLFPAFYMVSSTVVVLFIVVVVVAMLQPGSERTVISCMLYVKHICIYDNKVDFWLWLLTFDFTFCSGVIGGQVRM